MRARIRAGAGQVSRHSVEGARAHQSMLRAEDSHRLFFPLSYWHVEPSEVADELRSDSTRYAAAEAAQEAS